MARKTRVSRRNKAGRRRNVRQTAATPPVHAAVKAAAMEALEERRLLTITPDANNVITVTGTSGADAYEIAQNNGILIVKNINTGVSDQTASSFSGGLRVDLGAGDDYVRMRTKTGLYYVVVRATVTGGLGNDTIFGSENHDYLQGDDGNDRLDGRGGRDTLLGGNGFDTADYSYRTDPLRVTLDAINNDGGTYGESDNVQTEAILGGSASDVLYGDAAANLIDAGAGNDTLAGGLGNDTLTGGVGVDSIFGEDGNDYLFAREGALDTINDGTGIDSASVDSTLAGDAVSDVPTGAVPPAASTLTAAAAPMAFASFAAFAMDASAIGVGSVELPSPGAVLDPAFGTGGQVVVPLDGRYAKVSDVEYQTLQVSPGVYTTKFIVVGSVLHHEDYDFYVARFNLDGTPDTTFGGGRGYVRTDFDNGCDDNNDEAADVVVDSSGRLIVVGTSLKRFELSNSTLQDFGDYAIARYLPDGTLDRSFSSDGMDLWDVGGPRSDDRATGVAIQSVSGADRYLVVGTAGLAFKGDYTQFPTADVLAARWRNTGSKDTAFGALRVEFGATAQTTSDYASAVAVDASGNAWIAGYSGAVGQPTDFALAGLSSGGSVIAKQTIDLGGDDQALGIALTGGRAVVVGASDSQGAIATFNVDVAGGVLGEPQAATLVTSDGPLVLRDVRVDNDGRGVAVGNIAGATSDFAALRFDAQTLDPEGVSGIIDFNGGSDAAFGAVIGDDNSVLAVGLSGDDLAMARFEFDKPIAETLLSFNDVQTRSFTYEENGVTYTLPEDLTDRLRFALNLNGELTVNGTGAPDDILISQADGQITFDVNGEIRTYSSAGVVRIIVDGRGGNDTILADATVTIPLTLKGGDGDDVLGGGSAGDLISGQAGNDTLAGGAGNDSLDGGDGEDALLADDGDDTFTGGAGNDTVDYSSGEVADPGTAGMVLDVTISDTATSGRIVGGMAVEADRVLGDVENVIGTNGADRIAGSALANVIDGRGGADSLAGGDGDDTICGGGGNDSIDGGGGNDLLLGNDGSGAAPAGESDNDTINGGAGNDQIQGETGNDSLVGGAGSDTVLGGDGNDSIDADPAGGADGDSLDGGAGSDTIRGAAGADTIGGGDGNDSVYAGAGNDRIDGGADSDVLVAGAGNDTVAGAFGRDILIGGLGADSLDGGADDDILIGGYTSFDNDPASLTLIQFEWTTTLRSYTNRIANLNGTGNGGGLNGRTYLRPGTSSSKTVFDDVATDTLKGGSGTDWFFAKTKCPNEDCVLDREKSENLTQVS